MTSEMTEKMYRVEHDLIGERKVPAEAYYGVQTQRAMDNFKITGVAISSYSQLIKSLAMVKKATALANHKLKLLDEELCRAIIQACDDIIGGKFHDNFRVDVIQGGAGTSTNMNANEVIANRALEILGYEKGSYHKLHPNNHVNMSQSTNDVYPTSIRLSVLLSYEALSVNLSELCYALKQKAIEFSGVIKMGRTQLQDAVPITLGQEFDAYYTTVKEDIDRLKESATLFLEVNIGATAVGTGINSVPEYSSLAIEELAQISGLPLTKARNLVEATSDMGAFVTFSSVLKRIALKLSKICNDLRLMSSGPRAGLGEICLPSMQPGSSIMPGKVNPVIPEVVNQVAYQVVGNDVAVSFAAESGQLELNVMEPVIVYNTLQSLKLLTNGVKALSTLCIGGITANERHCRDMVNNSIGIITAITPYIGYEESSRIAKEALKTDRNIIDIIKEEGLLSEDQLSEILNPEKMTQPRQV